MVHPRPTLARAAVVGASLAGVGGVLVWLVGPLTGGPASGDAASSVLYFDRIVSGRHLEAFLNTSPKPLLTVVYGVLHAIDDQWRLVSLSAVLATAVGIVLAGEAARRTAGVAAAAFAIVALTGSAALVSEASWAYGLGWAFAFWMAAALMLLRPDPRHGLAGAFLAIAGLARPETLLVLGVALVILCGAVVTRRPLPPTAWRILIGFLAIPGLCLHDFLLTGDPLWWLAVAPHAVQINRGLSRSLPSTIHLSAARLLSLSALVVEATVGGLITLRRGQWVAAAGLIALGPLVIVETWFLALRHIEVLSHYLHPVDLAVSLGAAIFVGTLITQLRDRCTPRLPQLAGPLGTLIAVTAAAAIAIGSTRPFAPLSVGARTTIASEGHLDARAARLVPVLRANLPDLRPAPAQDPGPLGAPDPRAISLFVPRQRLSRTAVDLGLPLTAIATLNVTQVNLAKGYPPVGSLVYLDAKFDPASLGAAAAPFRVDVPTVVDGVRIVPIQVDATAGYWIVRITAGP